MRASGRRSTSEYCTWFETIGDAVLGDEPQPLGVEIGQREMADLAFLAQIGEMLERVEVARIGVIPPMELQQIEPVDAHPSPRNVDRVLDRAPRHRPRIGDPFGERLDFRQAVRRRGAAAKPAAELADQILGRAVMVGEVPGGKPGIVIGEHVLDRPRRVDRAMAAGDLPHAIEQPAYRRDRR